MWSLMKDHPHVTPKKGLPSCDIQHKDHPQMTSNEDQSQSHAVPDERPPSQDV